MSQEEKNAVDDKYYTPIQIVVLKALCQEQFIGFAKSMIYH